MSAHVWAYKIEKKKKKKKQKKKKQKKKKNPRVGRQSSTSNGKIERDTLQTISNKKRIHFSFTSSTRWQAICSHSDVTSEGKIGFFF